jgi:hypothetical protein
MHDIWTFLQDEHNRATLGWLGGGLVVVAGGIWTIVRFFFSKRSEKTAPMPTTSVSGGVVAGRDIRDTNIDIRS